MAEGTDVRCQVLEVTAVEARPLLATQNLDKGLEARPEAAKRRPRVLPKVAISSACVDLAEFRLKMKLAFRKDRVLEIHGLSLTFYSEKCSTSM